MWSYIAYTPRSGNRRKYIAESGVYIWQFTTAAQRNGTMEWPIPPSTHYRRATASTIEPPYSVLAQQPKRRTNLHKFARLFVQRYSAYLVCWTTHGWTDATASRWLATILTDANDNFTCQAVDPGIVLGPVCKSLPPLPAELWGWAFYC